MSTIEVLKEKKLMKNYSSVELDGKIKMVRQAYFKAIYKKKNLWLPSQKMAN